MMTPDEFFGALEQMPSAQPVFYRLYHDDQGRPLFYSMEDVPGTYIELDQETFAQGKSRVRVINGVLTELTYQTTEKLVPSDSGTMCQNHNEKNFGSRLGIWCLGHEGWTVFWGAMRLTKRQPKRVVRIDSFSSMATISPIRRSLIKHLFFLAKNMRVLCSGGGHVTISTD